MPPQDQSKEGKTYRFISDPKHKETLSGRVRAACVTCRRKKIKCDGEVPCNTCNERGLFCEGLTERKRPKTKTDARRPSDAATSVAPDSPLSTFPSPRAESSQDALLDGSLTLGEPGIDHPQRPTLRKSDTVDSGYSSGRQSTFQEAAQAKSQRFDQIDSRVAAYDFPNDLACDNLGHQEWSFYGSQNMSGNVQHGSDNAPNSRTEQFAASLQDWNEAGAANSSWWRGSAVNRPSPASLISAAKVLEDQAQSLRNLASQHHAGFTDPNRRQTIALPVSSGPGYPTIDLPSNGVGPLDDMALLFAARSPSTSCLQRNPDFDWCNGQADNYASFSNHQLATPQGQEPQLDNMRVAEFVHTDWNLAAKRNPSANEQTFLGAAPEQLVLGRNRFGSTNGTRSAIMEQPDGSFTWPER